MDEPLPLRLTDAAEADLAEIWATLAAETSLTVADGFVAAIQTVFEPLCRFPRFGTRRDQLSQGLRVTFHRAYAIYYLPQPEALLIVRIIHGARDISALAERGGFA